MSDYKFHFLFNVHIARPIASAADSITHPAAQLALAMLTVLYIK